MIDATTKILKFEGDNMEFKTRVKTESDMDAWELSEAYDVSLNPYYKFIYKD